ncbi:hypothetical protein PV-S19_0383 [Pacmanvirus S19]|nr:hypothetical protein PV-S19_0383 [Pacmanvirus S19]
MEEISIDIVDFRIQIVSDIHLELSILHKPIGVAAELLALCGDIGGPKQESYDKFLEWASNNYKLVFLIAGNHEYYHSHDTVAELKKQINKIADKYPNVKFLDNTGITINYNGKSVRVFGSTLWSDVSKGKLLVSGKGGTGGMNDYFKIRKKVFNSDHTYQRRTIDPDDMIAMHKLAVWHLNDEINLCKKDKLRMVVLTHHLPSYECIHPDYKVYPYAQLNCGYASNLDSLIAPPIVLWAHGHSHRCIDFEINGVRCVSNPMGYQGEDTKKYKQYFSVNIDSPAIVQKIEDNAHEIDNL